MVKKLHMYINYIECNVFEKLTLQKGRLSAILLHFRAIPLNCFIHFGVFLKHY
jgi:hypothetical protein